MDSTFKLSANQTYFPRGWQKLKPKWNIFSSYQTHLQHYEEYF